MSVGLERESVRACKSGAHIIQVVCVGKPVSYFKSKIDIISKVVFDTHSNGKTESHITVWLSLRVKRRSLTFRSQGTQKLFLIVQVCVWVVIEQTNANCNVGGKGIVRIAGLKSKEIEITLQGQFKNISIETQVTPPLEFNIAVFIRKA